MGDNVWTVPGLSSGDKPGFAAFRLCASTKLRLFTSLIILLHALVGETPILTSERFHVVGQHHGTQEAEHGGDDGRVQEGARLSAYGKEGDDAHRMDGDEIERDGAIGRIRPLYSRTKQTSSEMPSVTSSTSINAEKSGVIRFLHCRAKC
ncbi:MAG: hypothetical protein R2851_27475 [Caldilineaceae bacterium]